MAENAEHAGWTFSAVRRHISTAQEIAALEAAHPHLRSPPEMVFTGNAVSLSHPASGFQLRFDANGAMSKLPKDADGEWGLESDFRNYVFERTNAGEQDHELVDGVSRMSVKDGGAGVAAADSAGADEIARERVHLRPRVAHAAKWKQGKAAQLEGSTVFDFDWTFCTRYLGEAAREVDGQKEALTIRDTNDVIDIEMLKRPDPILFFHETVFYEDELADSGSSQLSLKMRVMPSCFLVLLRFFLRIDSVLFRSSEVRYFHIFGQDSVLREVTICESSASDVERQLAKRRVPLSHPRSGVAPADSTRRSGPVMKSHVDPNEVIPVLKPKLHFTESLLL